MSTFPEILRSRDCRTFQRSTIPGRAKTFVYLSQCDRAARNMLQNMDVLVKALKTDIQIQLMDLVDMTRQLGTGKWW